MLMKMKLTSVWRTKTKQWLCCTPPWHQLHWESAGVLHRITENQTLGRVEVGHQSTQPQWNSSRNKARGSCSVISRGTHKNLSLSPFWPKEFLRCYFSQGLFVIEMYPFSNRCMVYVCSNYRRCCPFHLCLCNSVWHHVIKVYVLCSLSSLLISLAFSLAIQNQYHCSFLNKKWTVEQSPNAHTDNLQQLDAVLTNDHPTGW